MFETSAEELYQDGEIIFEEDSYDETVYVVTSGTVEISKMMGDEKVVIEVLGEGYLFGELGYLAKIPRTATATSIGETIVGILDREVLDEDFNKLSNSFQTMVRSLALRLKKTTELACRNN